MGQNKWDVTLWCNCESDRYVWSWGEHDVTEEVIQEVAAWVIPSTAQPAIGAPAKNGDKGRWHKNASNVRKDLHSSDDLNNLSNLWWLLVSCFHSNQIQSFIVSSLCCCAVNVMIISLILCFFSVRHQVAAIWTVLLVPRRDIARHMLVPLILTWQNRLNARWKRGQRKTFPVLLFGRFTS